MIVYDVRDRTYPGYRTNAPPRFREVQRSGKLFQVEDTIIELFPVRIMSEALDRIPITIVKLEKEGKFPRPLFEVEEIHARGIGAKGIKRWYSGIQILNCNHLWRRGYRGLKRLNLFGASSGMHRERLEAFLGHVRSVFYEKDLLTDEQIHLLVMGEPL